MIFPILIIICAALDINFPAIKEIPNSGLLVSANHDDTANLKVFGVNAKKKQVKRIFSFEEIPGSKYRRIESLIFIFPSRYWRFSF